MALWEWPTLGFRAGKKDDGARGANSPGAACTGVDQPNLTFIEVPLTSTTLILTPTAGSLTPWFGSSS
jgi:hypothetical protein